MFQLLTSIQNLFQRFPNKLHNIFTKVLSGYTTHFSAFTCISDFIQQHSISMKISTITRLDRISRDVTLFKQQYDAQTISLKNMGTVNRDRTRNINTHHETRRILLQCSSFNHDRMSKATLPTETKTWDNGKIWPDEVKMN